jgi:hypothetical protein
MYVKTRKKFKHGVEHVGEQKEKMVHPEEVKKREEEAVDKSKSAERERQLLAATAKKEKETKRENSFRAKMKRKLKFGSSSFSKDEPLVLKPNSKSVVSQPGQDVESGIPPAGYR